MVVHFSLYTRTRKLCANPYKFWVLLQSPTCFDKNTIACSENNLIRPIACNGLSVYFSSWSSQNPNHNSHLNPNVCAQLVEKDIFDEGDNGCVRVKETGERTKDEARGNFSFNEFEETEESEEEEEGGEDDNDDDFKVLDSYNRNRNRKQSEDFRRVEADDDELRHPLVKEICRLIDLRSVWTPKLEGELRHLLRSLKPQQVCAVLRAQADERVALKFFYWADRQWRYRHDPTVYYAMLLRFSARLNCVRVQNEFFGLWCGEGLGVDLKLLVM